MASFSINAELFKWTDKNGDYHISDRPPIDLTGAIMKNKNRNRHVTKSVTKKKKKPNKAMFAWRCKELENQYDAAINKALRFSTNKTLAASMKSDAENYKLALEQICR